MSQFYLTLPSNSSALYYPNNTVAKFTTRLHKTFDLTGEWEVAMTELIYPHSWYTVGRGQNRFGSICRGCIPNVPVYLRASRSYAFDMEIPVGYYDDVESIVREMNTAVKKEFARMLVLMRRAVTRRPSRGGQTSTSTEIKIEEWAEPNFRFDPITRRVISKVPRTSRITFSDKLKDILGVETSNASNDYDNQTNVARLVNSQRVSDLEAGMHSMYVYCDLVEHVPVGDTAAPLLGIVDTEGKAGETIKKSFDRPRYIPLQKKTFDSLEIFISDAYGKPIPFENGTSTVTLHFRRAKDSYFLG